MHGKTSEISHDGKSIFLDLPDPFTATRYHSLAIERKSLPSCLEVSAVAEDGEIMGLRHREYPVEGIQFHPESILTKEGMSILQNFLNLEDALRENVTV
jgi:anthranilate synthase/aminodeoxychorismate synthase-like glutamine amidotransferase